MAEGRKRCGCLRLRERGREGEWVMSSFPASHVENVLAACARANSSCGKHVACLLHKMIGCCIHTRVPFLKLWTWRKLTRTHKIDACLGRPLLLLYLKWRSIACKIVMLRLRTKRQKKKIA